VRESRTITSDTQPRLRINRRLKFKFKRYSFSNDSFEYNRVRSQEKMIDIYASPRPRRRNQPNFLDLSTITRKSERENVSSWKCKLSREHTYCMMRERALRLSVVWRASSSALIFLQQLSSFRRPTTHVHYKLAVFPVILSSWLFAMVAGHQYQLKLKSTKLNIT